MQERIKQFENEVKQLKGAPPPAVATAPTGDVEDRVKKLEDGFGIARRPQIRRDDLRLLQLQLQQSRFS